MIARLLNLQVIQLIITVCAISTCIYLMMCAFGRNIPYNTTVKAHFVSDTYLNKHSFNLYTYLAVYDAQWYLSNAAYGYPDHPNPKTLAGVTSNGPRYAFFPLYPLLLRPFGPDLMRITYAAFIYAQLLIVIGAISIYYVVSQLYNARIASMTALLMYTFPLSIFFRSYFTEGLFLIFIVWFGYLWMRKNYVAAAIFLGLMCVTRGNALPLLLVFLGDALYYQRRTLTIYRQVFIVMASCMPLGLWVAYNYIHTGDPLYFAHVLQLWGVSPNLMLNLLVNILSIYRSMFAWIFATRDSPINSLMLILTLALLRHSYQKIPNKLWIISAVLAITPLLTTTIMSYGRYQIVSYPLFIYIATQLKSRQYIAMLSMFSILLLICSVFFINWYWFG